MKTLFNIKKEYQDLTEILIENGGEVSEELINALSINREELQVKGENYAYCIKEIEAQNDIIDSEIKRLQELKKSRVKTIDRMKTAITDAMDMFEIDKIETPTIKLSFRKSEQVEITNEDILPDACKVVKVEFSKSKIKELIKENGSCEGAQLISKKSLQIK